MTQLRVTEVAGLLGVSADTVRRALDAGRLAGHRDDAGRWQVAGAEVARFAQELAGDPALAGRGASSARNQLPAIVTRVVADTVMAQVDMQAGPFRLVALISAEAVREMGLEVGSVVTASVKATHVTVGVPER